MREIKSFKILLLSYYQIIGGILGIGFTFWVILSDLKIHILSLAMLLIGMIGFIFSIICGFSVLYKKPNALTLSLINQIIQLVSLSFLGFAFQYVAGLFINIGIDLTNSLELIFNIGASGWKLNFNQDSESTYFSVNIIAFYFIVLIEKLKREERLKEVKLFE